MLMCPCSSSIPPTSSACLLHLLHGPSPASRRAAAWDRQKAAVLRWARGALEEAEKALERSAEGTVAKALLEAQRAALHDSLAQLR